MTSGKKTISKQIKGVLKNGMFEVCSSSSTIKIVPFIKYWGARKINKSPIGYQLMIFWSKSGHVQIDGIRDFTSLRE